MQQITIPARYLVQCRYCGDAMNSSANRVYHRGTAWFKQSTNARTGTNAACLVEWKDEWACQFCIHKILTKVPVNQMELFHLPDSDD